MHDMLLGVREGWGSLKQCPKMNVSWQLNTTVELWWQRSSPPKTGQSQVAETTVAPWRQTNGHGATEIIFFHLREIFPRRLQWPTNTHEKGKRLWSSASQTSDDWKYTTERRTEIACWSALNYTHANPMRKQHQPLYSKPNYYHTAMNYPLAFLTWHRRSLYSSRPPCEI